MDIYFTESQIPELKSYPRKLRQALLRRALAALHSESKWAYWLPTVLCVIGTGVGPFVSASLLASFFPAPNGGHSMERSVQEMFWGMSGMGAGACMAGYLGLHFQFRKLRPYLRKAIKECGLPNSIPVHAPKS